MKQQYHNDIDCNEKFALVRYIDLPQHRSILFLNPDMFFYTYPRSFLKKQSSSHQVFVNFGPCSIQQNLYTIVFNIFNA